MALRPRRRSQGPSGDGGLITGALAVLGAAVLIYLVYLLAFSNGAAGTRRGRLPLSAGGTGPTAPLSTP